MSAPDWFNLIARERGVPEGWRWFTSEFKGETRNDGVFLIKGAVCNATFTRGKKQGRTNWARRDKNTEREIVITPAQLDEFKRNWQTQTGLCAECGGDGKQIKSISANGTEYRECRACQGAGKP